MSHVVTCSGPCDFLLAGAHSLHLLPSGPEGPVLSSEHCGVEFALSRGSILSCRELSTATRNPGQKDLRPDSQLTKVSTRESGAAGPVVMVLSVCHLSLIWEKLGVEG